MKPVRMVDVGGKSETLRQAIAKAELIPLCHPLKITHVDVDCHLDGSKVIVVAKVLARPRGSRSIYEPRPARQIPRLHSLGP